MATDPVCGMYVDERTTSLRLVRDNRTYYFCASACLEAFARPQLHQARLRRKLLLAWSFSLAIVVLTYVWRPPEDLFVAAGLATVVQFYPGLSFYRGAYDAVRSRLGNMDVLIAVGTTVAYLDSLAVLLAPHRFPGGTYFDATSLIVTVILTGNYLEGLTRRRASGALERLQEMLPAKAWVLRDGKEVEVPVNQVAPGDRLRVRAGAIFPTDGRVLEGSSSSVESVLTGEPMPRDKRPGDRVLAGTVNGEGALVVESTGVGTDTLLGQIGLLVTEASTAEVPLQRTADRIAAGFVPAVLALALLAGGAWGLWSGSLNVGLLVFVAVAITACPCAFGLATPAAILVATGRAAEEGVLFRGRDTLERAAGVDVVLTDKTGTLTEGRPRLTEVRAAQGVDERWLLQLAAGIESGSDHPLARAVRQRAAEQNLPALALAEVRVEPGLGASGTWEGNRVALRPVSSVPASFPGTSELSPVWGAWSLRGWTSSAILRGDRVLGALAFSDPVIPGAKEALADLRREGIEVEMVTGDQEAAARGAAEELGLTKVHAGLRPEQKLALLKELQARGHRVAFVGDGVNDAPALAASDLGIAIGAGTDVAKAVAPVILIRRDLRGVVVALRAGRGAVAKVHQNLFWALGYNAVLLPLAAGALVPFFGLGVYAVLPIAGASAMALSSTLVVLNSLSLRRKVAAPRRTATGRAADRARAAVG